MGIILDILDGILDASNDDKKKTEKLEKETDVYNLEEWQKERVRKGLNDPWDFDEDEIEEGDYYDDDE